MNRQERRRKGILRKDPMISIKSSDIKAMKDEAEECWDAVRDYIYGLKEVDYGRGSVVGGYFSRYDLDGYKEKIREMDILMADKWRLGS